MAKKQRKFVDDGWAIWTDGDDICTVYLQDWLNPAGNSYGDLAIRIHNVKSNTRMRVYIPFPVSPTEIEDLSLHFNDTKILQAVFGSACIVDYKKNDFTSEIAYGGKTVDIVHISTLDYQLTPLADGTLMEVDLAALQLYLDNDEAYFIWRMPHKSLDKLFKSRAGAGSAMSRFRDLITSPVLSEKHGYSVRINEARLLPEEITRVGAFHRQKLKKAVVTLTISEDYDLNDDGCYRIRHLEEDLYKDYIPKKFDSDDAITYQWQQDRTDNMQEQFNFYYSITRDAVNGKSMTVYMILLMILAVIGEMLADLVRALIDWLLAGGF
jgi:hypothetical protein